jgi:hypothetical protein
LVCCLFMPIFSLIIPNRIIQHNKIRVNFKSAHEDSTVNIPGLVFVDFGTFTTDVLIRQVKNRQPTELGVHKALMA